MLSKDWHLYQRFDCIRHSHTDWQIHDLNHRLSDQRIYKVEQEFNANIQYLQ